MKFLKENINLIIPMLICLALIFYAYGCEPTTKSLLDPSLKVTATELSTEFEILLLQHESRTADLERQNEIRKLIFNQGLLIAQSGSVNPLGLITSLMAIIGGGAIIDDVRLRKKIKKQ